METENKFLELLVQDINQNPDHLQTINLDLLNRTKTLIDDIDVDLNTLEIDDGT